MNYTMRYRDGYLCAVSSDTEYAEPFRYTNWWALVKCSEEEAASFIGKEGRCCGGTLDVYMDSGVHKQIPFPGDLKSRWQEREPVPPPKTIRYEVRWKDGRWEKFLKTRGWVAV